MATKTDKAAEKGPKTSAEPKKSAPKKASAPKAAKQTKKSGVDRVKALAPELAVRIGRTPETKYRGNPDVFGHLVEDHDYHRALLAALEATEGKTPERETLFTELTKELKSHAAAEEQALWSTVLRVPETTDDARHAIAEHKEIDDMLADLAARDMASSGWLKRFAALKEAYLHHLKEEEQEQFVAAEANLRPTDIRYMKSVYARRKREEKANAEVEKKIKLKD